MSQNAAEATTWPFAANASRLAFEHVFEREMAEGNPFDGKLPAYKFGRIIGLKQADVKPSSRRLGCRQEASSISIPTSANREEVPAACIPPGDARAYHQSVGA